MGSCIAYVRHATPGEAGGGGGGGAESGLRGQLLGCRPSRADVDMGGTAPKTASAERRTTTAVSTGWNRQQRWRLRVWRVRWLQWWGAATARLSCESLEAGDEGGPKAGLALEEIGGEEVW